MVLVLKIFMFKNIIQKIDYILSRTSILLLISGCVLVSSLFLKGLLMNKGATALPIFLLSLVLIVSDFIFFNAPINPVGDRVNFTALASATYSLFLEIAI